MCPRPTRVRDSRLIQTPFSCEVEEECFLAQVDLYVAGGGFYPARTLPCVIDVGTNNPQLLGSEEYLGVQRKRIEGKKYFDLVDEFMDAVKLRWPKAVIQFEDFEVKDCLMQMKISSRTLQWYD